MLWRRFANSATIAQDPKTESSERTELQASETIRVAIVEDDWATREGLSVLINTATGYQCVGKFGSVEEAMRGMKAEVPDVLLLDIHLPGVPGSEGVRYLRERYPSIQILMLTVYEEEEQIFESICNGACGYLLKRTPATRLLQAITDAREGGSPMSPEIARKVVTLFQKTGRPEKFDQRLTPQETKLLDLLAEGHSYNSSAKRLNISVNTVRNYIRSIYEKLHVHSKSEAVSKALRNRLIQ
jgi:DNA-binding NarL/FixJ family response regulator